MTDSFWKQNHYSAISSKDFHHTLKIIHCQMLMLIVNILRNTSIYVCASLCICCILSSWALHNVILDVGLNCFFVLLSLYPQVILSILFRIEYWEVFSFVLSLLNIRTMKSLIDLLYLISHLYYFTSSSNVLSLKVLLWWIVPSAGSSEVE